MCCASLKFVENIKYSCGLKYYSLLNWTLSTFLLSVSAVGLLCEIGIFFYNMKRIDLCYRLLWYWGNGVPFRFKLNLSVNFPDAAAPIIAAKLLFVSSGSWVSGEIWPNEMVKFCYNFLKCFRFILYLQHSRFLWDIVFLIKSFRKDQEKRLAKLS